MCCPLGRRREERKIEEGNKTKLNGKERERERDYAFRNTRKPSHTVGMSISPHRDKAIKSDMRESLSKDPTLSLATLLRSL